VSRSAESASRRSGSGSDAATPAIPPFHWWRTVFFLIPLIALYTIVLGTISLVSTLFDRTGDTGHWCARTWSTLILKTTGVRVTVRGLEQLDPRRSYVLAANHQSIYDIPIVFASIPLQLRIVAKASLGMIPFLGWHLRRTGHLLVDRKHPGASIVQKMRRLVSESHSLIVFPEGTRSVDGRVDRFKKGSFMVAIDAKLPVVPVSISGSRHIMAKGRLMVRPGEVQLTIHAPISTEALRRNELIEFGERVRELVVGGVDGPETAARGDSPAEVR
jgi:1-acyl-sn-glycerol-3-phosphate acyltransferase